MAEEKGNKLAGAVIQEAKSISSDYNYHIDTEGGLYKNVTAVDELPLEEEIKNKIKKYVLSVKRPTYAFNPDYSCKVSGSFNISGENLSNLQANVTFNDSENVDTKDGISLSTDSQDAGVYNFNIDLFVGEKHGILKYQNLKIQLASNEKPKRLLMM